ncbi:hypothetical protein ENSA5_11890 [Enhygromyxa salina]|uniref:Uncharacterized protein n=2 Tax=Enhygromyxa salina TaxID=215803 RepID=A0A2S9YG62_9BACT|nr:hypothetical protein ENSA5_11890 [Enhygromyxa salina]
MWLLQREFAFTASVDELDEQLALVAGWNGERGEGSGGGEVRGSGQRPAPVTVAHSKHATVSQKLAWERCQLNSQHVVGG